MYILPHQAGHVGPATVIEILPNGTPLTHTFASAAEMFAWIVGEHEAAQLLDQPIVDLTPAEMLPA